MINGINYDTGFFVGEDSRPDFDEATAAREMRIIADFTQSMQAFVDAGMHGAFWFTFGLYTTVRRPDDPTRDTDLASYGVVAMLDGGRRGSRYPEMSWEPKMVFDAMALRYADRESRLSAPASRTTVYRESIRRDDHDGGKRLSALRRAGVSPGMDQP